jgi:hypothetical protein
MRVHFYWPGCGLDYMQMSWKRTPRSVFWVSVSREELDQVTDHMEPKTILDFQKALFDDHENNDLFWLEERLYFFVPYIVTADDQPVLGRRIYPYSGMWNGRRPWLPVGPPKATHPLGEPEGLELDSLAQLEDLRFSIPNRYHLVAS